MPYTQANPLLWGKTDTKQPDPHRWLPLITHLQDTAQTIHQIWNNWVPTNIQTRLTSELGENNVAPTLTFLASIHDVGKINPLFQSRAATIYQPLLDVQSANGLQIPARLRSLKAQPLEYRHEKIGASALFDWLKRQKVGDTVAASYAQILAGHHGGCLDFGELHDLAEESVYKGDALWARFRAAYIAAAYAHSKCRLVSQPLTEQAQILVTGILVLADWIASNQDFFPLDPNRGTVGYVESAMQACRLPAPWSPKEQTVGEALFESRFDRTPRPFQLEVMEDASRMVSPGLLCIEAPMGEGKTEAAFLASEILAAKFGAGGLFLALPTQATADSIYSRLLAWRDRLPGYKGLSYLSHRNSWEIMKNLGAGTEWSWLNGRYRPNLKNFVAGTVDQVLLMARKAKYLVLRHLAVAGKVVVIDEVHAYDSFMFTYLERALEWLGAYHVPVILMSATLPANRKRELLAAYARGAGYQLDGGISFKLSPWRITTLDESGVRCSYPQGSGRSRRISVSECSDTQAISEAKTVVATGGCVLMVRDTVARAVNLYERLKNEGVSVSLVHSRFTVDDRQKLDDMLIRRFGPDTADRPAQVVVATQVAEQSLDVDFDLLISDIAPIDLLLQRAGRLFRHDRRNRVIKEPCMLVTGTNGFPDGIDMVYDRWVLSQTVDLLKTKPVWNLPEDIPGLVEAVYSQIAKGADGEEFLSKIKDKRIRASRDLIPSPHLPDHCLDGWLNNASNVGTVRDGGPVVEAHIGVMGNGSLIQLSESSLGYLDTVVFTDYLEEHDWVTEDGDYLIPADAFPFVVSQGDRRIEFSYDREYGWSRSKLIQ